MREKDALRVLFDVHIGHRSSSKSRARLQGVVSRRINLFEVGTKDWK
jgi:hypothetical protein